MRKRNIYWISRLWRRFFFSVHSSDSAYFRVFSLTWYSSFISFAFFKSTCKSFLRESCCIGIISISTGRLRIYICVVDALEWYVQFHIHKLFVCSCAYFVACFSSCYFLVPIQVHLCHIVSNGPCLCLDSHHLQNLTCNRKRTIPIFLRERKRH